MTAVMGKPGDDEFMAGLLELVQNYKDTLLCVRLLCDERVLRERIEGRKGNKHKKISTQNELESMMKKWDVFAEVKGAENSITIDNTHKSPDEVAVMIAEKLK